MKERMKDRMKRTYGGAYWYRWVDDFDGRKEEIESRKVAFEMEWTEYLEDSYHGRKKEGTEGKKDDF